MAFVSTKSRSDLICLVLMLLISANLLLELVNGLRFNQISIRFDLFGSNVAVLLP